MYIISVIALRKKKKEIAKNQYQLVIGKKIRKKKILQSVHLYCYGHH